MILLGKIVSLHEGVSPVKDTILDTVDARVDEIFYEERYSGGDIYANTTYELGQKERWQNTSRSTGIGAWIIDSLLKGQIEDIFNVSLKYSWLERDCPCYGDMFEGGTANIEVAIRGDKVVLDCYKHHISIGHVHNSSFDSHGRYSIDISDIISEINKNNAYLSLDSLMPAAASQLGQKALSYSRMKELNIPFPRGVAIPSGIIDNINNPDYATLALAYINKLSADAAFLAFRSSPEHSNPGVYKTILNVPSRQTIDHFFTSPQTMLEADILKLEKFVENLALIAGIKIPPVQRENLFDCMSFLLDEVSKSYDGPVSLDTTQKLYLYLLRYIYNDYQAEDAQLIRAYKGIPDSSRLSIIVQEIPEGIAYSGALFTHDLKTAEPMLSGKVTKERGDELMAGRIKGLGLTNLPMSVLDRLSIMLKPITIPTELEFLVLNDNTILGVQMRNMDLPPHLIIETSLRREFEKGKILPAQFTVSVKNIQQKSLRKQFCLVKKDLPVIASAEFGTGSAVKGVLVSEFESVVHDLPVILLVRDNTKRKLLGEIFKHSEIGVVYETNNDVSHERVQLTHAGIPVLFGVEQADIRKMLSYMGQEVIVDGESGRLYMAEGSADLQETDPVKDASYGINIIKEQTKLLSFLEATFSRQELGKYIELAAFFEVLARKSNSPKEVFINNIRRMACHSIARDNMPAEQANELLEKSIERVGSDAALFDYCLKIMKSYIHDQTP